MYLKLWLKGCAQCFDLIMLGIGMGDKAKTEVDGRRNKSRRNGAPLQAFFQGILLGFVGALHHARSISANIFFFCSHSVGRIYSFYCIQPSFARWGNGLCSKRGTRSLSSRMHTLRALGEVENITGDSEGEREMRTRKTV